MEKIKFNSLIVFLIFISLPGVGVCFPGSVNEWQLHDLVAQETNDLIISSGGDPYIVFAPMDKPKCTVGAVRFVIEFEAMPLKPFLMEFFWRSKHNSFSERRKVIFVLNPPKREERIDFVIRVDEILPYVHALESDLHNIRLDFPSDMPLNFRILNAETLPRGLVPAQSVVAKTLYRLPPERFLRSDTAIPVVIKIFKDGFGRMFIDPIFLTFWIGSILSLLFFIRQVSKSLRDF